MILIFIFLGNVDKVWQQKRYLRQILSMANQGRIRADKLPAAFKTNYKLYDRLPSIRSFNEVQQSMLCYLIQQLDKFVMTYGYDSKVRIADRYINIGVRAWFSVFIRIVKELRHVKEFSHLNCWLVNPGSSKRLCLDVYYYG
jgi:hypothetical protein